MSEMPTKNTHVIAVFTGKSVETILEEGGSSAWVVTPSKVENYEYVVCCRSGVDWAEGSEEKGTAFLIGRISEVVPSPIAPQRWLIRFSEFAEVEFPDAWKGWRNPVRYTTLNNMGIDLSGERFKPMPRHGPAHHTPKKIPTKKIATSEIVGMTIAEAKRGLANTFGVTPDAVEITIRG